MKNDIYISSIYNRVSDSQFSTQRARFYNFLETDLDNFQQKGDIFICGDFNAKMESSGDKNPDSVATAEFEGSALSTLSNLNSIHAFSVPTYRNVTQRSKIGESVIDLCLTNNPTSVKSFQVLKQPPFSK